MVLPNKYTTLDESYIGIAAYALDALGAESLYVDALWKKFKTKYKGNDRLMPSYIKFVYVIVFMFSCRMISYNERGEVFNENLKLAGN